MQGLVKMSLKAARVNAGLDQKTAAAALGVSPKTLGDWENYVSYPRTDMIPKICELYGVSYDQINFLPK